MPDERSSIAAPRTALATGSLLRRSLASLRQGIVAAGFWAAVCIPVLYAPLIVDGLDTAADTVAFVVLFAVHVVALVLGHRYDG